MRRSRRNATRVSNEDKLNSIKRKIQTMNPTTKRKLKKVISKYNKTLKSIKKQEKKKKKEEARIQKKYGRHSEVYKHLRTFIRPEIADNIVTMARELEKEERRVEKKIKDLSKRKERVTQNTMKLEKNYNKINEEYHNMLDEDWREKNISPEILEDLSSRGLDNYLDELVHNKYVNDKNLRNEQDKLETINKELLPLLSKSKRMSSVKTKSKTKSKTRTGISPTGISPTEALIYAWSKRK